MAHVVSVQFDLDRDGRQAATPRLGCHKIFGIVGFITPEPAHCVSSTQHQDISLVYNTMKNAYGVVPDNKLRM